ncbi:amidohydrolase family protein [Allokutzneria sp. A3M-2-11 16]|uniref:amidohydrolase family protein n=1 Tax=Allokutzneria sp. A3M-2-11 16 TaxID=2962043 RepID=UPI0020B7A2EC|nr:amidohydrolase family protein [Allokutzneria sp. A3M-2-11 16]MCP3805281.1 amidohydrolase family protein [Allokutzneria sp. A3M-2-11 16]
MRTVLANALVFDPDSGTAHRNDIRLVEDRIEAVGQGLDGDERIDCGGGLLLPGLIDCHAHVAFPRAESLPRSARILEAVPVLRRLLDRGVTTVRDAWGADAGFKHALGEGWITGPDLIISLRQLSPTGGLGDAWEPDLGRRDRLGDPSLPDPVFDGPDSARAAVRRMVQAGADWIKLGASGSLRSVQTGRDITATDEELRAVVDEARRCGRDVMAHAHSAKAATAAARAGVRSIEHGVFLDEEAVNAMRDCWYVPTLAPIHNNEAHKNSVRLAMKAGVRIAAGSDMAMRPHLDLLEELRLLKEAGLGDEGAVKAATSEAARLLRLDDDRGRVEPGLRADLLLLRDATLDVAALPDRVHSVWHNGIRTRSAP